MWIFYFFEKATYVDFKLTWTYALTVIFIPIPASSSLLSALSSVVSSELRGVEAGDLELVQRREGAAGMKLRSERPLGAVDLGIRGTARCPACCYMACTERSVFPSTAASLATPIESLRNLRLVSDNPVFFSLASFPYNH